MPAAAEPVAEPGRRHGVVMRAASARGVARREHQPRSAVADEAAGGGADGVAGDYRCAPCSIASFTTNPHGSVKVAVRIDGTTSMSAAA